LGIASKIRKVSKRRRDVASREDPDGELTDASRGVPASPARRMTERVMPTSAPIATAPPTTSAATLWSRTTAQAPATARLIESTILMRP
jgi:hypothetical protein